MFSSCKAHLTVGGVTVHKVKMFTVGFFLFVPVSSSALKSAFRFICVYCHFHCLNYRFPVANLDFRLLIKPNYFIYL